MTTERDFQRWRGGDEQAFECIARRYHVLLMMRVRRAPAWPALRAHCSEEDIVQEVWRHVVDGAGRSFEPRGLGSFCAYVCKITDNRIASRVTRQRALKRGEGSGEVRSSIQDELHAVHKPGTPCPETASSAARVSELQMLAAKLLSPDEYEAWLLVDNQGYSSQEAALALGEDPEKLGRTDAAVRGLLFRARAKLIPLVQSTR